jgi:Fe-S-cluster containining protein
MDSNMGLSSCLSCIASCCRLEIDLTRVEYEKIKIIGFLKVLKTRADIFIEEYPQYEIRREFLNSKFKESYAIIDKNDDGYCKLLDEETRLCKIYDSRPSVCSDYEVDGIRCKKIKKLN